MFDSRQPAAHAKDSATPPSPFCTRSAAAMQFLAVSFYIRRHTYIYIDSGQTDKWHLSTFYALLNKLKYVCTLLHANTAFVSVSAARVSISACICICAFSIYARWFHFCCSFCLPNTMFNTFYQRSPNADFLLSTFFILFCCFFFSLKILYFWYFLLSFFPCVLSATTIWCPIDRAPRLINGPPSEMLFHFPLSVQTAVQQTFKCLSSLSNIVACSKSARPQVPFLFFIHAIIFVAQFCSMRFPLMIYDRVFRVCWTYDDVNSRKYVLNDCRTCNRLECKV